MKGKIKNFIAECVCLGIEKFFKKYRVAVTSREILPLTEEEFNQDGERTQKETFLKSYAERYDKYRL